MENRIYRDFQRFGLQVSYKFNATKSKYKGTGAGQSEKNRTVTPAEKRKFPYLCSRKTRKHADFIQEKKP